MYNIFQFIYKKNLQVYRQCCGYISLIKLQVILLSPLYSFTVYFQNFYSKCVTFVTEKKYFFYFLENFPRRKIVTKNKNDYPQLWRSFGQFAPRVSWFQAQYYFNCLLVCKSCNGKPTFYLPGRLSRARLLAPWRNGSQPATHQSCLQCFKNIHAHVPPPRDHFSIGLE